MKRIPKIRVKVHFFHPEVTGSKKLFQITYPNRQTDNILIDCGIYQEKQYSNKNYQPFLKQFGLSLQYIDSIIVTHNHADHIGEIPYLVANNYRGNIHCSPITHELLKVSLADGYKIMKEERKRGHQKIAYSMDDVNQTLKQIRECRSNREYQITPNVKLILFDNAHILGASTVLLQLTYPGAKTVNIIDTGDYLPSNILFKTKPISRFVYKLDNVIVIQEATYGSTSIKDVKNTFMEDLVEILRKNMSVVFPSIAQGRPPQILFYLKLLQQSGELSKDTLIIFDTPLGKSYNDIYEKSCSTDYMPENVVFVTHKNREQYLNYSGQKIFITSSGMLDNGPVKIYLEEFLEDKNYAFFLTCHQSEGTLGYRLLKTKPGDTISIDNHSYTVNATVLYTSSQSSHAKLEELLEFPRRFRHIPLLFINHGSDSSKKPYSNAVKYDKNGVDRIITAEPNSTYIINSDGLERVITNDNTPPLEDYSKAEFEKNDKQRGKRLEKRKKLRKAKRKSRKSYQR